MNELLLQDFCVFAKAHVLSWDVDPTYPVLRAVYEARQWPEEKRLWFTLLYTAFYNLGSAERAIELYPEPIAISEPLVLPTGVERRGFRGNDLARQHINAVHAAAVRRYGSLSDWVGGIVAQGGKLGWREARDNFMQFPYGGNWSSYKWVDLLKNVHGYPITADDIGVGGGSATAGPIPGMVLLTGLPWKRCAQDVGLQQELHDECVSRGVPFRGLDQLETSLCDFNSLYKGRYYVGHDIDMQQEHFKGRAADWWQARTQVFEAHRLGEFGGWVGVRKPLRSVYSQQHVILQ